MCYEEITLTWEELKNPENQNKFLYDVSKIGDTEFGTAFRGCSTISKITITYGRGYVYKIQYHIVWCTKYRKPVLKDGVDTELLQLINELCQDLKICIITSECMSEHIRLLIDCSPQHFIPTIIKNLKGNTAKLLFEKYPSLKSELYGGHLWNPSYFVATVSETTEQQIKQYIDNQKTSTRKYNKK